MQVAPRWDHIAKCTPRHVPRCWLTPGLETERKECCDEDLHGPKGDENCWNDWYPFEECTVATLRNRRHFLSFHGSLKWLVQFMCILRSSRFRCIHLPSHICIRFGTCLLWHRESRSSWLLFVTATYSAYVLWSTWYWDTCVAAQNYICLVFVNCPSESKSM